MNIGSLNRQLHKLEDLYADNIISILTFNTLRHKVLVLIQKDDDLAYDDEINQIYRLSAIDKKKFWGGRK